MRIELLFVLTLLPWSTAIAENLSVEVANAVHDILRNQRTLDRKIGEIGTLRRNERLLQDDAMDWRDATKISAGSKTPKQPHSQGECLDLSKVKTGDRGLADYWSLKVVGVVNGTVSVLSLGGTPYILDDYPTKNLVTGQSVRLVGELVVLEPQRVDAIQLTVLHLISEEDRKKWAAEERESQFRIWTANSGGHTIEARLETFKDGLVWLEKRDGSIVKLKSDVLCKPDQEHYRQELRDRKKKD